MSLLGPLISQLSTRTEHRYPSRLSVSTHRSGGGGDGAVLLEDGGQFADAGQVGFGLGVFVRVHHGVLPLHLDRHRRHLVGKHTRIVRCEKRPRLVTQLPSTPPQCFR